MAEHLHGYPRCETPAGTQCGASDLHFDECKNHGAMRACEPSVVDGIPTGQYRCTHDEAVKAAPKAKKAAKSKPKPKAKAKPKAKKKAAPKKAKKAARKPAGKSRPAARKKPGKSAKKGKKKK
jgi:hypothetical protein